MVTCQPYHVILFLQVFSTKQLLELCDYVIMCSFFNKNKEKDLCVYVLLLQSMPDNRPNTVDTVLWSAEQSSLELTSQRKKDNNLSSRLEVKQPSQVWNVGI